MHWVTQMRSLENGTRLCSTDRNGAVGNDKSSSHPVKFGNGCKIVEQCRVAPSPDRERRGRRARQQCSRRDKQLHQLMQGDTMLCLQRCGLFRLQHEPV